MGSGARYLGQVGDMFYFKMKVSRRIGPKLKVGQIRKSLRTGDLKIAMQRVSILHELIMLLFKHAPAQYYKFFQETESLNQRMANIAPKLLWTREKFM